MDQALVAKLLAAEQEARTLFQSADSETAAKALVILTALDAALSKVSA